MHTEEVQSPVSLADLYRCSLQSLKQTSTGAVSILLSRPVQVQSLFS